MVKDSGSGLLELNGIGPSGAARLIGDIGGIRRCTSRGHFASWNAAAPLDASSGDQQRRPSPLPPPPRPRQDRDGSHPSVETTAVRHGPPADAPRDPTAGDRPGRTTGATGQSSAADQTPRPALRNSHFPDPPTTTLEHRTQPPLEAAGAAGWRGQAGDPNGRAVVTTRRRDAVLHTNGRVMVDVGLFTLDEAVTYLAPGSGANTLKLLINLRQARSWTGRSGRALRSQKAPEFRHPTEEGPTARSGWAF
ncbi:transposase [Dactylosporangium aurantiacum]|uniref:Transposase n=1 Tax=Dactylosporangium aurantiacum TaxID=35754 RepID=A0A9Q9IIJ5_9ACTN|nr:transposase [Dactylosporangium aurantiacum]